MTYKHVLPYNIPNPWSGSTKPAWSPRARLSSIYKVYADTYKNIKQMNPLNDNPIELISSPDIEFFDNYICLMCQTPLEYKPMDILAGAETGECQCKNTSVARNIINGNIKGVPIRDMVISLPNEWTIMMPLHGTEASWGATPYILQGNTALSRIVHAHTFKWQIHLEIIPEQFKNNKLKSILEWLDNLLPFS